MTSLSLSRTKQMFASGHVVTVSIAGQEVKLKNGETTSLDLEDGEYPLSVKSMFGTVGGTVMVPRQQEIELGFNVSDRQMRRRILFGLSLVVMTLLMVFQFDQKWAPILILVGTLPTIILNRKALWVDVLEEEMHSDSKFSQA